MYKQLNKLAILGSIFTLTSCEQIKKDEELKITNTYTLQSCDKETKAYFVEFQNNKNHYTGFIQTGNEQKIHETRKKFKIGTQINLEAAKKHFDGVYRTHE